MNRERSFVRPFVSIEVWTDEQQGRQLGRAKIVSKPDSKFGAPLGSGVAVAISSPFFGELLRIVVAG